MHKSYVTIAKVNTYQVITYDSLVYKWRLKFHIINTIQRKTITTK